MRQDDQRADATQADAANQRADANQADAVAADQSFDDTVEAVVKRLKANRANTLALCACLAVCETRMPYREAETLIGQRPELNLSTRFGRVLQDEPAGYAQAYAIVLALCEDGATKAAIEQALEGNPALSNPKQVFPSYFISKLETVGGLTWDGSWKATEAGRQMLALVG